MDSSEVGRYWEQNAETWTRLSRMGYDVYRDHLNTPAFLEMLPEVDGRTGLDIGCGEGYNTRLVARLGVRMAALDISQNFIRHALDPGEDDPPPIAYLVADGHRLPFSDGSFDFVTSFMCLMDSPDQERAFAEVRRVLRPGGFFQFSITHPCTDTPHRRWVEDDEGHRVALAAGGYFSGTDGEIAEWMFSHAPPELKEELPRFRVPYFHRTLSFYFNALAGAGFTLEGVCEPQASDEAVERYPALDDTRIAPMFLIIRVRLPK